MGPIVMVVEHCKIVDQSPKIGPMLVREMCSDMFSSSVSKVFFRLLQEEMVSDLKKITLTLSNYLILQDLFQPLL